MNQNMVLNNVTDMIEDNWLVYNIGITVFPRYPFILIPTRESLEIRETDKCYVVSMLLTKNNRK